jgi:hypothetical protein
MSLMSRQLQAILHFVFGVFFVILCDGHFWLFLWGDFVSLLHHPVGTAARLLIKMFRALTLDSTEEL